MWALLYLIWLLWMPSLMRSSVLRRLSRYIFLSPLIFLTYLIMRRHLLTWSRLLSDNVVQDGWYGNVVYLGKERGIPIITMTWVTSYRFQLRYFVDLFLVHICMIFIFILTWPGVRLLILRASNLGSYHCVRLINRMPIPW
jgi:predicted neutral ceramidase superfamily lipid hydrolase